MIYPENLHHIHLPSIDSTNNYLKRNYKELSPLFPVLVHADTQTHGRGRHERHWASPKGCGLYISFGFTFKNQHKLGLLPLTTGIAIVEALGELGDQPLKIKWPNDILLKKRKVAGILTETIILGDQLTCITGIGVNVNQKTEDFPPELRNHATSLQITHGQSFSIEAIKQMLSKTFFKWVEKLERGDGTAITKTINRLSAHSKGERITFHHSAQTIAGTFEGIDENGGLTLQEDGGQHTYFAGEIQME